MQTPVILNRFFMVSPATSIVYQKNWGGARLLHSLNPQSKYVNREEVKGTGKNTRLRGNFRLSP